MLHQKKSSLFLLYLVFILPLLLAYMGIFVLSMDTAFDRAGYIRLMSSSEGSRIEPLLPIISTWLNFLTNNPFVKLTLIQFGFVLIFLVSIYDYFKPKGLATLLRCFIVFLICLTVFANPFGVQLRMGYATILFIYFIIKFKKPTLFLFIPFFMHYGALASSLFFLYIFAANINNRRKFLLHSIVIMILLTFIFINIDMIFRMLGLSAYYYNYINEELSFGRAIPYSVVMYLLTCIYTIFFIKKSDSNYYWFSLSGLWLVYVGFFLDFYLAFKMLIPISLFALFFVVKNLPSFKKPYVYLFLAYLLAPIAFYYFTLQVNYI